MIIDTTIYINAQTKMRLEQAGLRTRKSRSFIITKIMKQLMMNNQTFLRYSQRIEYQKHQEKSCWHRLHVTMYQREYEYFLDMRKLCKRSVSLLIAIAIDLYLNEAINEGAIKDLKKLDNYLFSCYIVIKEIIDEVICWKIYWDKPLQNDKIFL